MFVQFSVGFLCVVPIKVLLLLFLCFMASDHALIGGLVVHMADVPGMGLCHSVEII